jgi:hypothetical protein
LETDGIAIDTQPIALCHLNIDVTYQDLAKKIQTSCNRQQMLNIADQTLGKVKNIWNSSAAYCWCVFQHTKSDTIGRIQNLYSVADVDFGHSMQFLTHASHALVSIYTTGQELELASRKAAEKGDLLEAYFVDLISLIILEKAGNIIKQIAQKKAAALGWGVSPFLSPGSVHGWELKEQIKLCSLLPIEKIDVLIRKDAVLSPFKTVSTLIGVGQGYGAAKVGIACQVCSKNHDCQMKPNYTAD